MALDAAGRAHRARGQQLFDRLVEDLPTADDLGRSRMFGSEALNRNGSIVAFVGLGAQLIVKLNPAGLEVITAAGPTEPVHIGRGVAKAWIGVPFATDQDTRHRWTEALTAAVAAARASDMS